MKLVSLLRKNNDYIVFSVLFIYLLIFVNNVNIGITATNNQLDNVEDVNLNLTHTSSYEQTYLPIDPDLKVEANGTIESATVSIQNAESEDRLRCNLNDISTPLTCNYDTEKAILIVEGPSSPLEFEKVLQRVEYYSTKEEMEETQKDIIVIVGSSDVVPWFNHPDGKVRFYTFISDSAVRWTEAVDLAEQQTYQGMQGYLATITSQLENDIIVDKISQPAWIGGRDVNNGASPREWRWVTGPEGEVSTKGQLFWTGGVDGTPNGYSNWQSGKEPNNADVCEFNEQELWAHLLTFEDSFGKWNDLCDYTAHFNNKYKVQGYFIEFGGRAEDPTVEEGISNSKKTQIKVPKRCPLGKYIDPSGNCQSCNPGEYCDSYVCNSCSPCPGGSIAPSSGTGTCTYCDPGTYSNDARDECLDCPYGTYCDHEGCNSCSLVTITAELNLTLGYAQIGEAFTCNVSFEPHQGPLNVTLLDNENVIAILSTDYFATEPFEYTFQDQSLIGSRNYSISFDSIDYPIQGSTSTFLIDDKSISISINNSFEYLEEGSELEINWTFKGEIESISLYLMLGDMKKEIADGIDPTIHSYSWVVNSYGTARDTEYYILGEIDNFIENDESELFEIDSKQIEVFSPEYLYFGQNLQIEWRYTGYIDDVSITLLNDGDEMLTIINNTSSVSGTYFWQVPTLNLTQEYQFLIESLDYPSVKGYSEPFPVDSEMKTLDIETIPPWITTGEFSLEWNSSGYLDELELILIKDNEEIETITSGIDYNNNTYIWNVENKNYVPGNNFQVLIRSLNFNVSTTSNEFEIVEQLKSIKFAPIPEYLIVGDIYGIEVDSIGIDQVVIELWEENKYFTVLSNNYNFTETLEWQVDSFGGSFSSKYYFRAHSSLYQVSQFSQSFSIDETEKSINITVELISGYALVGEPLQFDVSWTGTIGTLSIVLLHEDQEEIQIILQDSNVSNSWTWNNVSSFDYPLGDLYQARIASIPYPFVNSTTEPFYIDSEKALDLTDIQGPIIDGETIDINWTVNRDVGQCQLFLVGPSNDYYLISQVSCTEKQYEWKSNSPEGFSDGYSIEIESMDYRVASQTNLFEIDEEKVLNISLNNQQEYVIDGSQVSFSLAHSGILDMCNISLIGPSKKQYFLDIVDCDSNQFIWPNVYAPEGYSDQYLVHINAQGYDVSSETQLFEIDQEKKISLYVEFEEYIADNSETLILWQIEGSMEECEIFLNSPSGHSYSVDQVECDLDEYLWENIFAPEGFGKGYSLTIESLEYNVSSNTQPFEIDEVKQLNVSINFIEYVEVGTNLDIYWDHTGLLQRCKLVLVGPSNDAYPIDQVNCSSHEFSWENVNSTEGFSKGYKILIESMDYSTSDMTQSFEIDEVKSIKISKPQAPYLVNNSQTLIEWNHSGILGQCNLNLIGPSKQEYLISTVECDSNKYQWNSVFAPEGPSRDYQFYIQSNSYQVNSNSPDFEIDTLKELNITINSEQYVKMNSSIFLTWTVSGNLGQCELSIFGSSNQLYPINIVDCDEKIYLWEVFIPSADLGEDYFITIHSQVYNVSAETRHFEIDELKSLDIFIGSDKYVISTNPITIHWNHAGVLDKCILELIGPSESIYVIDHVDCNLQSYTWNSVIAFEDYGYGYYFLIESVSYNVSDQTKLFEIDEEKGLEVMIEYEGSYIIEGSNTTLFWSTSGILNQCKTSLVSPSGENYEVDHVDCDLQSYTWNSVIAFGGYGNGYRVAIESTSYKISDQTESFEIDQLKHLNISLKNSGDIIVGSSVSVFWDTIGQLSECELCLISPSNDAYFIDKVNCSSQIYLWNYVFAPEGYIEGYRIQIHSNNYNVSGITQSFMIQEQQSLSITIESREYVVPNDNLAISWNYTGMMDQCHLYLQGPSGQKYSIAQISCDKYYYEWNSIFVPEDYDEMYSIIIYSNETENTAQSKEFKLILFKDLYITQTSLHTAFPGDFIKIHWYASRFLGDIVVELLLNDTLVSELDIISSSDGEYVWEIPDEWSQFSDKFMFRLSSVEYSLSDTSSYFEITEIDFSNPIDVDIVDQRGYLLEGENNSISINSSISIGKISVFLVLNNTRISTIANQTESNRIEWTIPEEVEDSDQYQVVVEFDDHESLEDFYSDKFEIENSFKTINITAPSSFLYIGSEYTIEWSITGNIGNVNLTLYRESTSDCWLIDSYIDSNLLEYEWKIEDELTPADGYYIFIQSLKYPQISNVTETFEIAHKEEVLWINSPDSPLIEWNQRLNITWKSNIEPVSIFLMKNETFILNICDQNCDIWNDHLYEWEVPQVGCSNEYYFKILSEDYQLSNTSEFFGIDQSKNIVLDPINIKYHIEETVKLSWSFQGCFEYFTVKLFNTLDSTFSVVLDKNISDEEIVWKIPENITLKEGYYFVVHSSSHPDIQDETTEFEIYKPNEFLDEITFPDNTEYLVDGEEICLYFNISKSYLPALVYVNDGREGIFIGRSNSSDFCWSINMTQIDASPSEPISFIVEPKEDPEERIESSPIEIDDSIRSLSVRLRSDLRTLNPGQSFFITWNVTGHIYPVELFLCHLNVSYCIMQVDQFESQSSSINEKEWVFDPSNIMNFDKLPEYGFYFKLVSVNYTYENETEPFTLITKLKRNIIITNPHPGSSWEDGMPIEITWNSTGIGPQINIAANILSDETNLLNSIESNNGSFAFIPMGTGHYLDEVNITISSIDYPNIRDSVMIILQKDCPQDTVAMPNGSCIGLELEIDAPKFITNCENQSLSIFSNIDLTHLNLTWNVQNYLLIEDSTLDNIDLETPTEYLTNIFNSQLENVGGTSMIFNFSGGFLPSGGCFELGLDAASLIGSYNNQFDYSFCSSLFITSEMELPHQLDTVSSVSIGIWNKNRFRQCTAADNSLVSQMEPDMFNHALCVRKKTPSSVTSKDCDHQFNNHLPFFVIEPHVLKPDTNFNLEYTVLYSSNVTLAPPDLRELSVRPQELEVIVHPGDLFTVNIWETFIIDASSSWDPDHTTEPEHFEWQCPEQSSCPPNFNVSGPYLTLPDNVLEYNEKYHLTVIYQKGNRKSNQTITIIGSDVTGPNLFLFGIQEPINPLDPLRIKANFSSNINENRIMQWDILEEEDLDRLTPEYSSQFVLAENMLDFGHPYLINASAGQSFTSINMSMANEMTTGTIEINYDKTLGSYIVNARGFTSDSYPLQYNFELLKSINSNGLSISKGYTLADSIQIQSTILEFKYIRVYCRDRKGVEDYSVKQIQNQNSNKMFSFKDPSFLSGVSFIDLEALNSYWITYDLSAILTEVSYSLLLSDYQSQQSMESILDIIHRMDPLPREKHNIAQQIREVILSYLSFSLSSTDLTLETRQDILSLVEDFNHLGYKSSQDAAVILFNLLDSQIPHSFILNIFEVIDEMTNHIVVPPMLDEEAPRNFTFSQGILSGWKCMNQRESDAMLFSTNSIQTYLQYETDSNLPTSMVMLLFEENFFSTLRIADDISIHSKSPLLRLSSVASVTFEIDSQVVREDILKNGSQPFCLVLIQDSNGDHEWSADSCTTDITDYSNNVKCSCSGSNSLFTIGQLPVETEDSDNRAQPGTTKQGGSTGTEIGTILGSLFGIIGVIGCLTFLVFVILIGWRRRRRKKTKVKSIHGEENWAALAPAWERN